MTRRDADATAGVDATVAEAKRRIEELRRSLDESMSGRVVSLARVRELRFQLTMAGHEEYLAEMWAEYRQLVRMLFLIYARILLDWVQHCCEEAGVASVASEASVASVDDEEAVEQVADDLRYSSVFRRKDAVARRYYCESHGVPFISVQSHTRAGIPVQGYERYAGTPHYDALPVDEYPPVVGRVVRLLQRSPPRMIHRPEPPPGELVA